MVGIVVKNKAARSQDSGDKKSASGVCLPHAPDAGSAQYRNEIRSCKDILRASAIPNSSLAIAPPFER
jgi:hypothetical protein